MKKYIVKADSIIDWYYNLNPDSIRYKQVVGYTENDIRTFEKQNCVPDGWFNDHIFEEVNPEIYVIDSMSEAVTDRFETAQDLFKTYPSIEIVDCFIINHTMFIAA